MERHDFDRMYSARMDNTEGYTQAQLDAMNHRVFEEVARHLDPTHYTTSSIVHFAFERACVHYDVIQAGN